MMLILPVDCMSVTCSEPLTYTPPGSPCGCVWPLQVKLRISIAIYKFFPLVSELADEISASVLLNRDQVRIVGADAASHQREKTTVLINLVPQGVKFDDTAAFIMYKKFWHREILTDASRFGAYEVLYVHYPGYTCMDFQFLITSFVCVINDILVSFILSATHAGLPPSPPSTPSSVSGIDVESYPGGGNNNGAIVKPLGVDVSRKKKEGSGERMIIV